MALSDNLISYWKLDEASNATREDSVGSNDLTDVNTVAAGTGKINNGADFESSASESLQITDAAQSGLDFTNNDISISFWFKPESLPASWAAVAKQASGNGYRVENISSGTILRFAYGSGSLSEADFVGFWGAGDIGNWRHVVLTLDISAGTVVAYKDGAEFDTITGLGTTVAGNAADFRLGAQSAGNENADGVMDEVGIWDRVLTAGEVTSLYNSGNGNAYPFSTAHSSTLTETATVASTLIKSVTRSLTDAITSTAVFEGARTLIKTLTETLIVGYTNYIRNNSMQGAVVGTPGTRPTFWTPPGLASGMSLDIVALGTEDDMDYIEYRYHGTAGSVGFSNVRPDAATQVVALQGQDWTGSFYAKLVGGSTNGLNVINMTINEFDSGGAALAVHAGSNLIGTLSSAALSTQRYTRTATLTNASTAFVDTRFRVQPINGQTIDITFRIGWPQLERGTTANRPIRTTSAAASDPIYLWSLTRTLSDAMTAADTAVRSIARTITDAITSTDAIITLRTAFATLAETVITADSLVRDLIRTLVDTFTQTDTSVRAISRSLVDAVTGTDVISRVTTYVRTYTESATVADLLTRLKNGSSVFWTNISKSAGATLSNIARSTTDWDNSEKSSTTWNNQERT